MPFPSLLPFMAPTNHFPRFVERLIRESGAAAIDHFQGDVEIAAVLLVGFTCGVNKRPEAAVNTEDREGFANDVLDPR